MENNLQRSPKLGHPDGISDAKYVSGLGTILVSTIQEAKDRISHIEHIFCGQLYPNFQLKYQNLEKMYSEAKEAVEDANREKQHGLLPQIEKLQCEKEQILKENHMLRLDKEKLIRMKRQSHNRFKELQKELKQKMIEANEGREVQQNLQKLLQSKASIIHSYENTVKELEEKKTVLMKNQKSLEVKTDELQLELMEKSKEVDEVMELQNKLLLINQSNASLMMKKEMQLKEYEENANKHISELEKMENRINDLLSQLREKTEEVDKGKELQENLLKKFEFQTLEIMKTEELLNKHEKENKLLSTKVENLANHSDALQKELGKRTFESDEGRKLQEQLLQQSDAFNLERIKRQQELEKIVEEKKQLMDKQKGLEDKIGKLQQLLFERTKESSEGMELHGKLLRQIGFKDSEMLSEKRKRRDAVAAYKRLKSQYNFLCKKYDVNPEIIIPLDKVEEESKLIRHNHKASTLHDIRNDASKSNDITITNEVTRPEGEQQREESKVAVSIQRSSTVSPSTSGILIAAKFASSIKSCPPAGAKRTKSYWRDTRSREIHVGLDPHDDFLNTPLENLRKNFGKVMKEYVPDFPQPGPMGINMDNSGDDMEGMNADAGPQKLDISPQKAGTSGFKYVESVRKKSERESLKGVECKQCKKFYDAVLPDGGKNSDINKQNIRREHHDGISRHRYRYAPPLTPEGFWNLGFESEI